MDTITTTGVAGACQPHDAQPAYVVLGRKLALIGLALYLPALALLVLVMAGKQMSHDHCVYEGCTEPLMKAIGLSWRVMWAAGATGVIAALLPRRVAELRLVLACLHLALLIAPFYLLSGV
ncbi:hypothetical protein ACFY1P_20670 [Streptomyces sp. NPDC001407]|uniref:hypothetical protein n=1 Tax=Streptomyces sp. NPDC001407 TaxID=3364573 RepID=UPI0036BF71BA